MLNIYLNESSKDQLEPYYVENGSPQLLQVVSRKKTSLISQDSYLPQALNAPDDIQILKEEKLRPMPPPELRVVFQPQSIDPSTLRASEHSPSPSPIVRLKGTLNNNSLSPQEFHMMKYGGSPSENKSHSPPPLLALKKSTIALTPSVLLQPHDALKRVIVH